MAAAMLLLNMGGLSGFPPLKDPDWFDLLIAALVVLVVVGLLLLAVAA